MRSSYKYQLPPLARSPGCRLRVAALCGPTGGTPLARGAKLQSENRVYTCWRAKPQSGDEIVRQFDSDKSENKHGEQKNNFR